MPMRSWCIAALVLLPGVASLTSAQAQNYRPDTEGFPCGRRAPRAIVANDEGFAIAAVPSTTQASTAKRPAVIAIGSSLKIDRAVIERATTFMSEARDAERR